MKLLFHYSGNTKYKKAFYFCSLLKSAAAQEGCEWLDSVVGQNSLLLKELDLSKKGTGDSGVMKLSALMEDSHCKFQKVG